MNSFSDVRRYQFLSINGLPYHLFRFVSICFVSFCFVSFRFFSFRFDLFRFVSICFVSFRSVSFRSVSFLFRFALYRDPSYSPLHSVDVQTLRIGWCIKTKYNIYMYCPLNYPWNILSRWNSFHYCWIQGNGKFNLKIYALLHLYSTSPYYNNAHNFVFETELHQSKDFDEVSDLD